MGEDAHNGRCWLRVLKNSTVGRFAWPAIDFAVATRPDLAGVPAEGPRLFVVFVLLPALFATQHIGLLIEAAPGLFPGSAVSGSAPSPSAETRRSPRLAHVA